MVRSGDQVVTSRSAAADAMALEIEFADGRFAIGGGAKPARKAKPAAPSDQGSLF